MNPREIAQEFLRLHPTPGATARGLEALLAACEQRDLADGDALCREGEPAEALFFLLFGRVSVRKRDARGAERPLGALSSPCILGQVALIDGSARSATCVSEGASLVAVLPRAAYERLVRRPSPEGVALRRVLLTSLSRQLTLGQHRVQHLLTAVDRLPAAAPGAASRLLEAGGARSWEDLEAELGALEAEEEPSPDRR